VSRVPDPVPGMDSIHRTQSAQAGAFSLEPNNLDSSAFVNQDDTGALESNSFWFIPRGIEERAISIPQPLGKWILMTVACTSTK
jgi:hypothetical protein